MLSRTVRVLVGAAVLLLLGRRLGAGPFVDALHAVNGVTLTAAVAVGALTTVFSAWRWVLVARALGAHLSVGGAVADYYRALFLNAVLPGGVLGDVHRAVRHGRGVGDVVLAAKAVVLERTAGQVVLVAAVASAVVLDPSALPLPVSRGTATVAAAALVGLVAAVPVVVRMAGRRGRWPWAASVRGWSDRPPTGSGSSSPPSSSWAGTWARSSSPRTRPGRRGASRRCSRWRSSRSWRWACR
jgi:uncharacterized membrane protein YbhN (UPF0104 family)